MAQINLNEQARQILKIAEEYGVEQNFFFITTFKRYQVQIGILTDLERTINEEGTLVTKEYVKGRKNVYSHPAISDYNRTTDSANKTVVTLMKIITTLRDRQDGGEPDPLLELLAGHGACHRGSLRVDTSRTKTTANQKPNCSRLECNAGDVLDFKSELGAQ